MYWMTRKYVLDLGVVGLEAADHLPVLGSVGALGVLLDVRINGFLVAHRLNQTDPVPVSHGLHEI